ncbi:MAG: S-layer homology domain-containing protein [Firmicutes bacterium]|nr:S-layer homology domain-containing protein [Bacillota bacterium]
MKKVLVILVSLAMLFSVVPVAMGAFEDMPKASHWAYDNFMLLYNAGLLKGYPDGTFKGERYATRYEMVELTARILKYLENQMYGTATLPENGGRVALTEAQAKELIRRALEEEQVATAADIDALYDALWELEYDFRNELDARSDINVTLLADRVADLETRMDAVEQQTKSNKTIGIVALILGVAGIVFGFVPAN